VASKSDKNHRKNRPKLHGETKIEERRAAESRGQAPAPSEEGRESRTRRTAPFLFHFTTAAAFVWPPSRVIPSSSSSVSPSLPPSLPHPSAKPALSPGLDATRRSLPAAARPIRAQLEAAAAATARGPQRRR